MADPLLQEPAAEPMRRAVEILRQADEVALACHINPDPDALGSMLGLGHALAARGAHVACSWGEPKLRRPTWLAALDDGGLIVDPSAIPEAPPVMVTLDAASIDRLGSLVPTARRAGELIMVDHHRTNPGFGSVDVLDPDASSTAEIVFRLIEEGGFPLTDAGAACLYAGIVTDTGRFQYQATTPQTLRVAATLRERSFDHAALAQALYADNPLGFLRVLDLALGRLAHVPEASLVWTYLMQSDLDVAGVDLGETDDVMDVIRSAREADVACVVKQQRDGRFKVSLRSKGATDVGAIAQAHGGGGHRLAAGYTSAVGPAETAVDLVGRLADAPG
jgi:bifunctional oligoribonuclease and PAP phosphatase NrnA